METGFFLCPGKVPKDQLSLVTRLSPILLHLLHLLHLLLYEGLVPRLQLATPIPLFLRASLVGTTYNPGQKLVINKCFLSDFLIKKYMTRMSL